MLIKRQLERMTKRYTLYGCESCDQLQRECRKAAETALAYREMLERLEWSKIDTINGIIHEVCPICEHHEHEGHTDDCKLGELLKEVSE